MAKTKLKAPDLQYLLRLKTESQLAFQKDDQQIREMREMREQTRAISLPDKLKHVSIEVRDGTITDEILRGAAAQSNNLPQLKIMGAPSDSGQSNSTLRERWTVAALFEAGRTVQGRDTYEEATDAQYGDGGAWTKLVFNKDRWEARYSMSLGQFSDTVDATAEKQFDVATEDAKRGAGVPLAWLNVDPLTLYPGPDLGGTRGPEYVIEVQRRPVAATFRQYRLGFNAKGDIVSEDLGQPENIDQAARHQTTVEMVEYWDQEWIAYAITSTNFAGSPTGRIVKKWRHGYGRTPYFNAPGITFNYFRNRKVGWSIAESKKFLVEYLWYLRTLHAQVAARDAGMSMFREVPDGAAQILGDNGAPKEQQDFQIGVIYNLRPGEKIQVPQLPPVAQSIREEIAMVEKAIEQLTTPRVQSEFGSNLQGAGFAISQILAEITVRFNPLVHSMQRMLKDLTKFLWYLVREKIREDVWVYQEGKHSGWLKAGPEDLTDTVGIQWTIDPERPSAKLIEWRGLHERLERGTIDEDLAIDRMGDNPDEIRLGKARDRIRKSQWYQAWLDKVVAEEAGRGDLLQLAQQAQQVAQTGSVPAPNGAVPAMGNGQVPDLANLATAQNGAGALLQNGSVQGMGPGAVNPTAGAGAGIQSLGG